MSFGVSYEHKVSQGFIQVQVAVQYATSVLLVFSIAIYGHVMSLGCSSLCLADGFPDFFSQSATYAAAYGITTRSGIVLQLYVGHAQQSTPKHSTKQGLQCMWEGAARGSLISRSSNYKVL